MRFLPEHPTSRWAYILVPGAATLMGGIGARLVSMANDFPPEAVTSNGFGWGLIFGATALMTTVSAIGNERTTYWEFCKAQTEAGVALLAKTRADVPRMEQSLNSLPEFFDEDGWGGTRADFASLNKEQCYEMARRAGNGDYSLAYNKLRTLLEPDGKQISDKKITTFRQELRDRGFAIERGRGEVVMTSIGKRHFFKLHQKYYGKKKGPVPHLTLKSA